VRSHGSIRLWITSSFTLASPESSETIGLRLVGELIAFASIASEATCSSGFILGITNVLKTHYVILSELKKMTLNLSLSLTLLFSKDDS
jgi:hypothetical protein